MEQFDMRLSMMCVFLDLRWPSKASIKMLHLLTFKATFVIEFNWYNSIKIHNNSGLPQVRYLRFCLIYLCCTGWYRKYNIYEHNTLLYTSMFKSTMQWLRQWMKISLKLKRKLNVAKTPCGHMHKRTFAHEGNVMRLCI